MHMQIEDFIKRVSSEPDRFVTRMSRPSLDLLAKVGLKDGIMLTDFISEWSKLAERREVRYGHVLGSPASPESIDMWEQQHPHHVLPDDLRLLISRINGIHLWADLEDGRAYVGLAPIDEWQLARVKMHADLAEQYVAITYHQDGASFVVLDFHSGRYFLMDSAGPDTTAPIADSAGQLLDWLWQTRIEPK